MRTRTYLLTLLTAIMVFNYVDRLAMGLMLQDIKTDLHLSDTQLGFLTGIAFALFYAAMGIPIARWADRGNRVTIVSVTVALWSVAVASCAVAGNFVQMLLLRIGVAVGEAGCHPPAFSLISDYFGRAERPQAVARYMLGYPLAALIGNFVAGWFNEIWGWRVTFVLVGCPGVLLALLAALTLREPRSSPSQSLANAVPTEAHAQPNLRAVFSALWTNATYRNLLVCFSLSYFFGNGILQWQPAFFVRTHGLHTGELGTWFALIYGGGGLLGTWIGGELAARFASNNEGLQFKALGLLYIALSVLAAGVYLAPSRGLALALLSLSATGMAAVNGPLFAATQTLVPARMRAMSIAIVLFFSNLIGLGLGPLAVGALSDALQPSLGDEALHYALLAITPGYFWCAWHLWRASLTVSQDLPAEEQDDLSVAAERPSG